MVDIIWFSLGVDLAPRFGLCLVWGNKESQKNLGGKLTSCCFAGEVPGLWMNTFWCEILVCYSSPNVCNLFPVLRATRLVSLELPGLWALESLLPNGI